MLSFQLFLTNTVIIFSVFIVMLIGIFALLKGSKKRAAVPFFLLSLTVSIFYVSHLIGINAVTAETAWIAFMFNLANLYIVTSTYHFQYELFGEKTRGRRGVLIGSYIASTALLVFYLAYPHTFMELPVPKMYLPFYYEPGSLYWLMRAYFVAVAGYALLDLLRVYKASNPIERKRVLYILVGVAFGYTLGTTALFLVYDVPLDPLYSMFFGFYTVPFFYAFLKYDLLDFRILAKRAFLYAVFTIIVGLLIVIVNAINNFFVGASSVIPFWLIPLMSALVVAGIGTFVWHKIQEVDKLKYEFVTTVTHKFRTPLTYIIWSADTLEKSADENERKQALDMVKLGARRLSELTSMLADLDKTEIAGYQYEFKLENISDIVRSVSDNEALRIREKDLKLALNLPPEPLLVKIDKRRMESVLQILIENAISYTAKSGTITVTGRVEHAKCIITISDTGIGIPKDEMPYMFSKFFRGKEARHTDTEGLGIGLHIAQQIAKRHGGDIEASSDGSGLGATFTLTLPA